jgi:Asparagine synthase
MTDQQTTIRLSGLSLALRPAVALRERSLPGATLFYLCLYDDEIDERFEHFRRAGSFDSGTAAHALLAAGGYLELTDAVIVHCPRQMTAVLRGGSCTVPLFWRPDPAGVGLSTFLPVGAGPTLSRSGLVSSLASACMHGSYEPNAFTGTPLHGWSRARRGAVTVFEHGRFASESPVIPGAALIAADAASNLDVIAEQVRAAFDAYRRSQSGVTSAMVELSGGFDSTLAAAAARGADCDLQGISVQFPYYEFRFEEAAQLAVAADLDVPRSVLDGTNLLPFSAPDVPARFDEPTVFVTGIRHAEQVARHAAAHGATTLYVGHGGDQLFSTDLTVAEEIPYAPTRAPFSREAWRTVRQALAHLHAPCWRQRRAAYFVYDARQDVWAKENFGVTIRTPFSDLALFLAARRWSQWSQSQGARPDKTILIRAVGELLPTAVTERRGKVAYNGVWARSYKASGDHIAATISQSAQVLEHIGLSPGWLLRHAQLLAQGKGGAQRDILAAYSLASWLLSWEIERVSDAGWAQ